MSKWYSVQLAILEHDLPARAVILFVRLVAHHNHKTGQCNPGEQLLAAALNCSTRTIRSLLRELEAAGLVKTHKGPECPPRNHYTLTLFNGDKEVYRKAEVSCLQRRKKTSGKPENEPKKYIKRRNALKKAGNTALSKIGSRGNSEQDMRQRLEGRLVEKLGSWEALMEIDEVLIASRVADLVTRRLTVEKAADRVLTECRGLQD